MIRSQFSYCTLNWMFCSIKSVNLINEVHVRSSRIVCGDNHSSFKSLLSKYKETTIHQRNLQVLMTKTYKIINKLLRENQKKKLIKCFFKKNSIVSEHIAFHETFVIIADYF